MRSCCVLGLGYIGLPTSALIAQSGINVIGVDTNPEIVSTVNNGRIHIVEPGLSSLVASVVSNGSLQAHHTPVPSDVFIIAVPTPVSHTQTTEIPQPSIDFVLSAATSIASVLRPGNLVIIESTSPVGTTESVLDLLCRLTGLDASQVLIAYCPERVLPGQIIAELVSNDRIIGGINTESSAAARSFYSTFCKGKLLTTLARTAELAKLAENSYRDVNIAYANELSLVCESLSIDTSELISLANHHPRVNILNPGPGVGGHCIAVDPWFIASQCPSLTPLIQTARSVNTHKSNYVVDQILLRAESLTSQLGRPPRIGCLGLAYKPDVDDLRESPALYIVSQLLAHGLDILVSEHNLKTHETITLSPLSSVFSDSDLLVFLVAHTPYRSLSLANKCYYDVCGVTQSP